MNGLSIPAPDPVRFIQVKSSDTLEGLQVEPGWYVRSACCSIWCEVVSVVGSWVVCVARDPRKGTDMVSIGDNYSSVNEFCIGKPSGLRWIAADRTKSFYDKFFPEIHRIVSSA